MFEELKKRPEARVKGHTLEASGGTGVSAFRSLGQVERLMIKSKVH